MTLAVLLFLLVGASAIGAFACTAAGLLLLLEPPLGVSGAAFAIAASLVVLCGVLALFAWMILIRRRSYDFDGAVALFRQMGGHQLLSENKGAALVAATLIGLVIGSGSLASTAKRDVGR